MTKNSKHEKTWKCDGQCFDLLLFTTISWKKIRKIQNTKKSSKHNDFVLFDCYPLRFHEKNFENSKQIKIRENTTVLFYLTEIHFNFTRKMTKFKPRQNFVKLQLSRFASLLTTSISRKIIRNSGFTLKYKYFLD